MRPTLLTLLLATLYSLAIQPDLLAQNGTGFFRAEGTEILDPAGNPVVPLGMGLGGWLMPEGYMLHIAAPDGGSPTSIRNQIEDLIGSADADRFYEIYEANYVDEKDIAEMASWGIDHVRLPFHYKLFYDPATETFKEDGFAKLDSFLEWCRTHGLAVILDMHAAPGAQNEGNISDSDGVARLWTEPVPYQDQTVEIWKEIARRYVDEPLIMGYDLINEPVTPAPFDNPDLRALYVRIADSIRTVDTNHILFIEGNYYATHFPELDRPFDDNMVYAFHKYWNGTGQNSIDYLLRLRQDTNVPLWLGETGENSNTWFHQVSKLMDQHGIGINWWTHKKIETTTSPLSAPFAPGYEAVLDYWRGTAPRPNAVAARDALFAMAEGLDLDSCEVRSGVMAALFDPNFGTMRRPFKEHVIPGLINAADYDEGMQAVTYWDTDFAATTGAPGGGNNGTKYRNDGVDIELSTDPQGFRYNVGWMETSEWITYTVNVETAGIYDIEVRVASDPGGGRLRILMDDVAVGSDLLIGSTGGWQNWVTAALRGVSLEAGEQRLKLQVVAGGFNVNRMVFRLISGVGVEDVPDTGETLRLDAPYPNPFTDDVRVRFETGVTANVSVKLFDVLGREVHAVPSQVFAAGTHSISVRPGLAAGVYMLQLSFDDGRGESVMHRTIVKS